MQQPGTVSEQTQDRQTDEDVAWGIVQAAARCVDRIAGVGRIISFRFSSGGELLPAAEGAADVVLEWRPQDGWKTPLPPGDPRTTLIDLYLPICNATRANPIVVGHLGQSLDGFIATHAGESRYVTGHENIVHLHRMRALCDAVVVGAGTVAADDPQLTTRHVPGPSPLRVVIDPTRRLADHYKVFSDDEATTLYVFSSALTRPDERTFGRAGVAAVEGTADGIDIGALLPLLYQRGCVRIFVEGGGVTVSTFLEANLLDRLQMTVAPLIIGEGRPAVRLAPPAALRDCRRPSYRVFRMGGDVLFDCDLRVGDTSPRADAPPPGLTRII
jgi:riboflavin-specific deaminase-like protein